MFRSILVEADDRTATNSPLWQSFPSACSTSPATLSAVRRPLNRLKICPASVALPSFARASSLRLARHASPRRTNHAGMGRRRAIQCGERARLAAHFVGLRGISWKQDPAHASPTLRARAGPMAPARGSGTAPASKHRPAPRTAFRSPARVPQEAGCGRSPLRRAPSRSRPQPEAQNRFSSRRRTAHVAVAVITPSHAATAVGRPHRME